jgi:hypothetical protein
MRELMGAIEQSEEEDLEMRGTYVRAIERRPPPAPLNA